MNYEMYEQDPCEELYNRKASFEKSGRCHKRSVQRSTKKTNKKSLHKKTHKEDFLDF